MPLCIMLQLKLNTMKVFKVLLLTVYQLLLVGYSCTLWCFVTCFANTNILSRVMCP